MKHRSGTRMALAAAVLLLGTLAAKADQGGAGNTNAEIRLRTRLTGATIQGRTPEGNADFRSDSRGRTRLNVEVENVNLPSGTVLTVSIQHGATVLRAGTITLSAAVENELDLDSQDGDVVPAIQAGDMVIVTNAGTTILVGVF